MSATPDIQGLIKEAKSGDYEDRAWMISIIERLVAALPDPRATSSTEWGVENEISGAVIPMLHHMEAHMAAEAYSQYQRVVGRTVTRTPWEVQCLPGELDTQSSVLR